MEEAKKILQKTHGGLDVFKHYLGEDCTAQFSVILIERIKGHLAVCIRTSLEEIVTTISFKTSVIANSVVIVLSLLPNCLAIT